MDIKILDLTVENAFDFCAVLDAIGVSSVIGVFDRDEIRALRAGGKDLKGIGLVLAAKAAGVLIGRIPDAKEPLYTFLAGCTRWENGHAVTRDDLRTMPLGKFMRLIRSFAEKEDIADFFTDAAGFMATGQTGSGSSSAGDTPAPATTLTAHSGEGA